MKSFEIGPAAAALFALLAMSGCALKKPSLPPESRAPVKTPVFDRTYGEVEIGEGSTLRLQYKSILILVDPFAFSDDSALVDYLLLTDAKSHHFGSGSFGGLRRNIKIICPKPMAAVLQSKGFSQVKPLSAGGRILLQKNGANVFVVAYESKGGQAGEVINSYLLEFDNGRNVFIEGELPDAASMREIVYQLRDDGKEAHFGFFYGNSGAEEKLSKVAALLQPKVGFVLSSGVTKSISIKQPLLEAKLNEELFDGFVVIPKVGEKYPF